MAATYQPEKSRFLGIPTGGFGLFSSLLVSFSLGFVAFFATCFVAIFAILIYNGASHHAVNFADSYRYVGLPAGLIILAISLFIFLGDWLRRKLSGN